MKKSTISELCHKYGSKRLADFLEVDKSMMTKVKNQGYAPPEWNYNLLMLIDGQVPPTLEKLHKDIVNNKVNGKPMVNLNQVNDFLSPCKQCRQRVGKNRQVTQ